MISQQMEAQIFWNEVGSQKNFEDPFYLTKLAPYIDRKSNIIDYGCGYGRILNLLYSKGYYHLSGFDLAQKMIERGKKNFPYLDLHLLRQSAQIPVENASVDAVIISTVLCCIVDQKEQQKLIEEIERILKSGGVLYLTDFLICDPFSEKYRKSTHADFGVYQTSEGVLVKHHKMTWITLLLRHFEIQWLETVNFKTMNHNPAKTFHLIAKYNTLI
jgi:SAM-dependent methyltransferase